VVGLFWCEKHIEVGLQNMELVNENEHKGERELKKDLSGI